MSKQETEQTHRVIAPGTPMASRRFARDAAVRMLYRWSITGDASDPNMRGILEDVDFSKADSAYIIRLTEGVHRELEQIDATIDRWAIGWSRSRMGRVDLAILRCAIYEMLFEDGVPDAVAINEAVELSRRYCSDESAPFINGILSSVYKARAGDSQAAGDDDPGEADDR